MFRLMGSRKISLYCEDVIFCSVLLLFYFDVCHARILHSSLRRLTRTEQSLLLFGFLEPEKCHAPNKKRFFFFQSEDPKRAVSVLSNTFFMMGIQDTLKINTAWDTLISRGSWNSVGTSLFAGNLRLILSVTGAAGARFYYNCVTFNTPWRDFNFSIFLAYNKSNVLL